MLVELFWAILLGILAGVITGLTPGIHINLVALLAFSFSPLILSKFSPVTLAVFIVAMAINHTFLDTIPSIFLGAPDPDSVLSILPGHKLLLEGKGYAAVALTVIGSFCSLIVAVVLTPVIIQISRFGYPLIQDKIVYLLILACIFLILKEKTSKLLALGFFLLSGALGLIILSAPIKDPLFPLFSGLFGISTLLVSLKSENVLPPQVLEFPDVSFIESSKAIFSSVIAGVFTGFLPGLGPSQAAALASSFIKKLKQEYFLMIIGGLSTVNMIVSFIAFYTIQKARNGAVITISKVMESFGLNELILLLSVTLLVGGIATILALKIAKVFSLLMEKINYESICISIICFIVILTPILSGPIGLLILITSTAIGILPQLTNVGRNHLMGCLLLPVILFLLL